MDQNTDFIWLAMYPHGKNTETTLKNLDYFKLYGDKGVAMKIGITAENDVVIGDSQPFKGLLNRISESPVEEINYCVSYDKKLKYLSFKNKYKTITAGEKTNEIKSIIIPSDQTLKAILTSVEDNYIAGFALKIGPEDINDTDNKDSGKEQANSGDQSHNNNGINVNILLKNSYFIVIYLVIKT